ncbi:MAG: hypothetical protein ACFCU8_17190 [Thermosynechococcaceae cyanobacterium]
MKLQKLLPISATIFLGLASMPAFAGTSSVTNSWNTRDIKNGYSKTSINVHENYNFWRDAYSDANKQEYGITVVTDNLDSSDQGSYDSRTKPPVKPNDDSSKFFEVDVYKADASSWAREWGDGYRTTDVNVYESYEFSGFDKTHTVSSGFSF